MVTITAGRGLHVARIAKERRSFLRRHLGDIEVIALEI